MKNKLLILGSINIDHTLTVDRFPNEGETTTANSYTTNLGGKGCNQVIAAHRSGADIIFISSIGDDTYGKKIIDFFNKEGVNSEYILQSHAQTGFANILVNNNAENQIVIFPGANNTIKIENYNNIEKLFEQSKLTLLQLEIPINTVMSAIKLAKKYNNIVILNPAPAKELSDQLLSMIDIITPNETEIELLTGIKINSQDKMSEACKILHDKGIPEVIITLGSNGCWYSKDYIGKIINTYKVIPLDTTAAGDTFNGFLANEISKGTPTEISIQFANAAAALSVTKKGTHNAIPSRQDVELFLNK